MKTRMLTRAQVARLVARTQRTIANWEKAGHLTPRRIGRSVFYDRAEVESLLGITSADAPENEVAAQ